MPNEISKSGLVVIFNDRSKIHFQRKPFENRYRKKVTDLWRFTSVWPAIVTGGPPSSTFLSSVAVTAIQTLTSEGDEVPGYSELLSTALVGYAAPHQVDQRHLRTSCRRHLDLS